MQYLLESAFCLAILYGFYWFLLRKETFFQWNRWYLLLAPVLAFTIPAVQIQLEKPAQQTPVSPDLIDFSLVVEQTQHAPLTIRQGLDAPVSFESNSALTIGQLLHYLYAAGAVLLGMVLLFRLWRLYRFIRSCRKKQQDDHTLAIIPDDRMPVSSFFSFVFWNQQEISPDERLIIEHELVHARQWHSLDVLFMELLVIWQWFNPLIYFYRRSLKIVHEYIADEYVVRRTRQRHTYATLLAQQYLGRARPDLVNTFHAQLKHRLLMLAKHPSHHARRAKFALAFPLAFGLMLLFSFRLIERIPGAAPVKQALQKAELFSQRLSEIIITADKPAVVNQEPTSYIFYWGAAQTRLMHDANTNQFTGEIHLSAAEFREAIKREPRLWNGQSLEQHLSLIFKGFPIRSDYNDESVYNASRKAMEPVLATIADGGEAVISKIPLPGGKFATVTLLFDQEDPKWIPRNTFAYTTTSPLSLVWDRDVPNVLWNNKDYSPALRQFCTVDEFRGLLQSVPLMRINGKDPVEPEQFNLFITRKGQRVHTMGQNMAVSSFDSARIIINQYMDEIKPGVHVSIFGTNPLINDTLFSAEGNILHVINSNRTLGHFTIVEPGSPLLNLTYKDRSDHFLEWGNFSQRLVNLYGKEMADNASPMRISSIERPEFYAKEILEMLQLPPRFYRQKALLEHLKFTLTYKDRSVEIMDGKCPPEMVEYIKSNIQPHDNLTISNIRADGASMGEMKINLDVKPVSPKPPLNKVNPADSGSDQVLRMFPPTPNPATDQFNCAFFLPASGEVACSIANMNGQIVWTQKGQYDAGSNQIHIRTSEIQGKGVFVLTMQSPFGSAREQLVIE